VKNGIDYKSFFTNTNGMGTNYEKITESLDLVSKRLQHSLGDPVRLYAPESLRNRRASILVGPRGVGKTTYLLRTFKMRMHFIYRWTIHWWQE
jgi:predicted AAA+ superfamily ATPase